MTNRHKDLDQGDVQRDADNQFGLYLESLYFLDDTHLREIRYSWGEKARQGDMHGVPIVSTIDYLRSHIFGEDPFDEEDYA
jgi:hypothetical protein